VPTQTQTGRFSHFCTAHGRKSLYFTLGAPFPKYCPFPLADQDPHLIRDSLGQPEPAAHTTSRISIGSAVFAYMSLYFIIGRPFPMGDLNPHLTHGYLGSPESSTQMPSRSVQPFLQGSPVRRCDRQTDRPRYSVGNNRLHLRTYCCYAITRYRLYMDLPVYCPVVPFKNDWPTNNH